MEISFEKFRCFGERQSARIAPVTLLVGENSSGKSTFMSGLRYMLDFIERNADPSFNKDPFFLGGYRNIAHSRGRNQGRAPSFKIGMSESLVDTKVRPREPELFPDKVARTIEFFQTFSDVEGDAWPVEYTIGIRNRSVRIFIEGQHVKALVRDEEKDFEQEIRVRRPPHILTARNDFLTLEFILRDLALGRARETTEVAEQEARAASVVEEIWTIFRRLGPRRAAQVYALAPVRTRPLRSYDPTQLSPSSEGDQLIAKLGKMARVDAPAWKKAKASLEAYGRVTGLFDGIKIQKLGRGESDPFQIVIRASGRETNIIDVGYGVSQVLPLLIMLSELDRHSTLLIQQPEVHLHPKAQAALGSVIAEAAAKSRGPTFVIETHSDFIAGDLANNKEELKPMGSYILKGGRLAVNGALFQEYPVSFRSIIVELKRSGKVLQFENDPLPAQIANAMVSDDPHLVGLVRASGLRVVCTKDDRLIKDLKNPKIVGSPRCKVYKHGGARRVLTGCCP